MIKIKLSLRSVQSSLAPNQFLISGYTPPFRLTRDNNGGGIIFFVREDIPCKLLSVENHAKEGFYIGINLRKTKWLLCCSYNLNRCKIEVSLHYENFIIIGDFNVETNGSAISVFSDTYDLKSLIKEPACYKNPNKPYWTDLILTNKSQSSQHSVIEKGLSDFCKMTVTVIKRFFE